MLALFHKTYYYMFNTVCQDSAQAMNLPRVFFSRKGAFIAMTERNLTMLTDF